MKHRAYARVVGLVLASLTVVAVSGTPAAAAPAGALSSDYNGDGYADVVVGEPQLTISGIQQAGAARVFYGTSIHPPLGYLDQSMVSVPGALGAARFGAAIASGNFDGDAYADVAIGAPYGNGYQGEVVVLFGSSAGLNANAAAQAKAELLTAAALVAAEDTGPVTKFGAALAAADFNGDGYADLAIGASGATTGGGIRLLFGGPGGLNPSPTSQWFDQDTAGMPSVGTAQTVDEFGAEMVAGDFNGDTRPDLAVSAPGKAAGGFTGAGQVLVLFADATGSLTAAGALAFHEASMGMPGTAGTDDAFGSTLAAGDITGDGRAELAVAAQTEAVNTDSVTVLKGSPSGPTTAGVQLFVGDSGDSWGRGIAIVDTDGNKFHELVIGAPGRTISARGGAGAFVVWKGTADGVGDVVGLWTQNSVGVLDEASAGDGFGTSLRAIRNSGAHTDRLLIGVPGEDFKACGDCGMVAAFNGGPTGLTATGNEILGRGDPLSQFGTVLG